MSKLKTACEELTKSINLLTYGTSRDDRPFPLYRSKLADIAKLLPDKPARRVSQDHIAKAKESWEIASKQSNFSLISFRQWRILGTIPEIFGQAQFAQNVDYILSENPALLKSLVSTHHILWSKNVYFMAVDTVLNKHLQGYGGKNKTLAAWKNQHNMILGIHAPKVFASEMIKHRIGFADLIANWKVLSPYSQFGAETTALACERFSASIMQTRTYVSQDWDYLFNTLLNHPVITKANRAEVAKNLILATDVFDHGKKEAIERLKDWLLVHKEFGDPRITPVKWDICGEEATRRFISWLSEEDIKLFFETIMENRSQGRKDFWINYLGALHGSKVILSPRDKQKCSVKLNDLERKGRRFLTWQRSGSASAFVLDFGTHIAVEFSEASNACYIYEKPEFEKHFPDLPGNWTGSNLKNSNKHVIWQTHQQGWQEILRYKLSIVGVHAKR